MLKVAARLIDSNRPSWKIAVLGSVDNFNKFVDFADEPAPNFQNISKNETQNIAHWVTSLTTPLNVLNLI